MGKPERISWLDNLKAMAIFFVVLGHTIGLPQTWYTISKKQFFGETCLENNVVNYGLIMPKGFAFFLLLWGMFCEEFFNQRFYLRLT